MRRAKEADMIYTARSGKAAARIKNAKGEWEFTSFNNVEEVHALMGPKSLALVDEEDTKNRQRKRYRAQLDVKDKMAMKEVYYKNEKAKVQLKVKEALGKGKAREINKSDLKVDKNIKLRKIGIRTRGRRRGWKRLGDDDSKGSEGNSKNSL